MIDWIGVITNSVWLSGLAVCLAMLSYADWQARISQRRLRAVVGQPVYQSALWIGMMLFSVGVALSGGRWWERLLWSVLALMAIVELWHAVQAMRAHVSSTRSDTLDSETSHRTSST